MSQLKSDHALGSKAAVIVDDRHSSRLVMDFMLSRRCFEALVSLQLELGLARHDYSSEALFAYMLVLQGRWDDVMAYLQPLQQELRGNFGKSLGTIYKQKYLEALSWQGGGGHLHAVLPFKPDSLSSNNGSGSGNIDGVVESDVLVRLLKSLEDYCSSAEFEEMVKYLTLYRLSDHPSFKHWSVSRGRYECACTIATYISAIYPSDACGASSTGAHESSSMHLSGQDALVALLSVGLSSQSVSSGDVSIDTHWNEEDRTICTNHSNTNKNHYRTNYEIKNRLFAKSAYHICEEATTASNRYRAPANIAIPISKSVVDSRSDARDGISSTVPPTSIPLKEDVFEFAKKQAAVARPPISWTVDVVGDGGGNGSNNNKFQNRLSKTRDKKSKGGEGSIGDESPSRSPANRFVGVTGKIASPSSQFLQQQPSRLSADNKPRPLGSPNTSRAGGYEKEKEKAMGKGKEKRDSPKHFTLFQHHAPIRCVSIIPNVGPFCNRECEADDVMFALGTNSKSVHVLLAKTSDIARTSSVTTSNLKLMSSFDNAHSGSVYCMDYSPDVGALVTGSNDKTMRILNVSSKAISDPLAAHSGTVRVVKFRPTQLSSGGGGISSNQDGSRFAWNNTSILASGGAGDCCTRIWDVAQASASSKLAPNAGSIHGIAWLDNYSLASGCDKGSIVFHDIRDVDNFIWSSDIRQLIYQSRANFDHSILESLSQNSSIYSVTSDIDNQLIHVGCSGGYTCCIDIRNQLISGVYKPHGDDVRSVLSYANSPQKRYLCSSSYDSSAHLFACVTNSQSRGLELERLCSLSGGHSDKILSTAMTNHGKHCVITTGADGKAIYWI